MELIGRWWNGERDPQTRRDIWLHADDGGWLVRARDTEQDLSWPRFHGEWEARALVDRLIAASPGGRRAWKDITKVVRKPPEGGWSARTNESAADKRR